MFHIGQVVVCVDGSNQKAPPGCTRVVRGCVYTVRAVEERGWEGIGLLLEEIVNPINEIMREEWGYYARRFRPAVSTDISIFQAMLSPAPKVDA